MTEKKQAVVVIHGMGQQKPMDTLRSFVETVWVKCAYLIEPADKKIRDHEVWSKPDQVSTSLELRRITTRSSASDVSPNKKGRRTDFYEYYWAHHTQTTTWDHFWDWFLTLLLRRREQVPDSVLHIWRLLWAVTIVATIFLVFAAIPVDWGNICGIPVRLLLAVAGGGLGIVTNLVLIPYFGDVARYVRAAPTNIKVRHDIRSDGLDFLEKLHQCDEYDRIIVVGHSLGSIVAYDLINLLWQRRNTQIDIDSAPNVKSAITKLEGVVDGHSISSNVPGRKSIHLDPTHCQCYRLAQRELSEALSTLRFKNGGKDEPVWLISDFVSLGSPLAHAEFLMARDAAQLRQRIIEREYAFCPPVSDDVVPDSAPKNEERNPRLFTKYGLTYWDSQSSTRHLHVGSAFAPVRWTNIHDPADNIIFGDQVSGPVKCLFGPGIDDQEVEIEIGIFGKKRLVTHTEYWHWRSEYSNRETPKKHITALWQAMDLLDNAGQPPASFDEKNWTW